MHFLITGSSGFIGSRVAARLVAAGHQVAGFDRRPPEMPLQGVVHFDGDLLDARRLAEVMAAVRPEVVVHLAARASMKDDLDGRRFAPNTTGTRNLMEAMLQAGSVRRALYTSTKYVFRGPPPAPPRTYRPNTAYGRSKAAMEEMIWDADGACAEWCILRPSTIWGPGVSAHYRMFLRMVKRGRYVHLGRGESLKHLGQVENVAFQIEKLASVPAEAMHRQVFYLGDYQALRVGEWAEAFRDAFGAPPIRSVPLPLARLAAKAGDIAVKAGWRKWPFTSFRLRNLTEDDLCDMEPTREVCGEVPVTLEEGARQTVRWFNGLDEELRREG